MKSQHKNAEPLGGSPASKVKPDNVGPQNRPCEPLKLLHPFTCMVVGMTGSGKTVWVQKLMEHAQQTIQPSPQRIVWCYSHCQLAYTSLLQSIPSIEFVRGIPADLEQDWYFDPNINNLFVIDDQLEEASNNNQIMNLFTKGSHHRNLSVIYLLQNVFHQGKINRTVSLNCQYLVLFKNPGDKMQIMTLAKQMSPRNTQQFLQTYEDAVKRPYGYLFVDLKPSTPDHCRRRKNVLPGEEKFNFSSHDSFQTPTVWSHNIQPSVTTSPIITQMKKLNQEINTTLARTDLNPDIQATLYNQKLQRFLAMKQQTAGPISSSVTKSLSFDISRITEPELPYVDLSIPETDEEQGAQEEEEIVPSTSTFHFRTPATADFEYPTPESILTKDLALSS